MGNAETYMNIGEAMGKAMVEADEEQVICLAFAGRTQIPLPGRWRDLTTCARRLWLKMLHVGRKRASR